jgi:hypothetical protein
MGGEGGGLEREKSVRSSISIAKKII